MNYSYLANQSSSLRSELQNFFDLLSSQDFFEDTSLECPTNFDISRYVPFWIVEEKVKLENEYGTKQVSVFDFLQKYYDWLYCDNPSGAQYTLSQNLLDLVDIEKTRTSYLNRFLQIYGNGLDPSKFEFNGGSISNEKFIKLLKGISKNFNQKKTTIDSIKYFFLTLFPEFSEEDFSIYYPKVNLLRLNGGKFYSENFTFRGGVGEYDETLDLGGSSLNDSRIQDSDWFQDFSYILKTGINQDLYKTSFMNTLHPAGLRALLETNIEDYPGAGVPGDTDLLICETPILGNYHSYQLGTTYNTQIGVGSFGGSTFSLYGLTYCVGCAEASPWNKPTHVFPNWSENIVGFKFNDINIDNFINMCYVSGFTSPNAGLTCGAACAS